MRAVGSAVPRQESSDAARHPGTPGDPRARAGHGGWKFLLVPVVLAGFLVAASLLARWLAWRRELAQPGIAPPDWVQFLDVNGEANLPTWFSVVLLASTALTALVLGAAHLLGNPRGDRFGLALGVVLLGLSLDELAGIHERLGGLGNRLLAGEYLHFTWVVPGAVVAAVLAVALVRGSTSLPARSRRLILLGFAVYVLGALVLETLSGLVLEEWGDRAGYLLVTAAEEFCEMLGVVVVLGGLVRAVELVRDGRAWVLHPAP